jgi:hypothetical protein
MGRKRHTAEQIIGKLRTAEIELAKGLGTAEVVRKLATAELGPTIWTRFPSCSNSQGGASGR